MPGQQAARTSLGRGRAPHRHPGQLGQFGVAEAVHARASRTGPPAGSRTAAGRRRPAPPAPPPRTARAAARPGLGRRRPAPRWTPGRPPGDRRGGQPLDQPGSSAARTPWPIRSAPSVVQAGRGRWPARPARRRAGRPAARPARRCGTRARSPRPARAARRWTGRTRSRRGPAYCTASRASVRASSGCLVRFAAITTPIPTPVAAAAAPPRPAPAPAVGVRPPNRAAYPDGSTWISSQPRALGPLVLARSRGTSRRMSAGVRSTDRAMSYSRWNRNQPRSSVPRSCGGQSSASAVGQVDAVLPASSTSVECRIAPVKCRCRCALGSCGRADGPSG